MGCFFSTVLLAQNIHTGTPISWGLEDDIVAFSQLHTLNDPNIPMMMFEDEINAENKNKPLRFASSIPVNYSFVDGTWRSIGGNGDRVWSMIVSIPNAVGIGVNFNEFHLPKDCKLFIYNEDHSVLRGAYTHFDNKNSEILVTIPIQDNKIIIEYFEPAHRQGDGRISIETINYQYRSIDFSTSQECSHNVRCEDAVTGLQLNSVVKIITDSGKELGSGVLVSSVGSENRPFILTSAELDKGNPEGWHFIFNNYSVSCDERGVSEDKIGTIGATILTKSDITGMMLLELDETPTSDWNIYYSGWNRDVDITDFSFSLHFSNGGVCEISTNESVLEYSAETKLFQGDEWSNGQISSGGLGAPLFDEDGFLMGIFSSGTYNCETGMGKDVFVSFFDIWEDVKQFLDPINTNPTIEEGKLPPVATEEVLNEEDDFKFFPIPADNTISLLRKTDLDNIERLKVFNVQGQLVIELLLASSKLQSLDISSLDKGWYVFQIISSSEVKSQAVIIE